MITYAAIDYQKSKRIYYGSAKDAIKRQRQHLSTDLKTPFHDALRARQFYWVFSEDDSLDSRDEEQFYIDFYHGSEWCYNLSRWAVGGNQIEGERRWVTNGLEERFRPVEEELENGWTEGRLGWSLEQKTKRSEQLSNWEDNPFRKGMSTGKRWATNGTEEKYVEELPEGWKWGRKKFTWTPGPKKRSR